MMFDVEKLINLVYENRILYDVFHDDFKNNKKKEGIWNKIGMEMNKNGEETKKKWRNLRDTYAKYLKVAATKKFQSENKKKWIWAEHMRVFLPYHGFTPNISNFDPLDLNEENASEYEDVKSVTLITENERVANEANNASPTNIPPENVVCTPTKNNTKCNRKRKSLKKLINRIEIEKKKKEHDAVDCLFLAHAKTLKTFSKKGQIVTKMKIAQIMMEQELLEQDNLEFTQTPPAATEEVMFNSVNNSQSSSSDDEHIY